MTERRRFTRHGVAGNIYVTFRPDFEMVGIVRNISQNGIGFEYTSSACLDDYAESRLDLFLNPLGFRLMGIRYKVVYDTVTEAENDLSCIRTRRCGVELTGLSPDQSLQLCELIHCHASAAEGAFSGE